MRSAQGRLTKELINQLFQYVLIIFIGSYLTACKSKPQKAKIKHTIFISKTFHSGLKTVFPNKKETPNTIGNNQLFDISKSALLPLLESKKGKLSYTASSRTGYLTIGYLFNQSEKSAVLMRQQSTDVFFVQIFQLQNNQWKELWNNNVIMKKSILAGMPFQFIDFDNNGERDFFLVRDYDPKTKNKAGSLWLKKGETMDYISGFQAIPNPEYDPISKKIYGSLNIGCDGKQWLLSVGKFSQGDFYLMDEFQIDACDCISGECRIVRNGREKIVFNDEATKFLPKYFSELMQNILSECE